MLTTEQLAHLGFELRADSDQPGKFLWVHDQNGSEISFDTLDLAQADASEHALKIYTLSECQGCGKVHSEENLAEIKHFSERVAPGEEVPSGECPDCGALCHSYRPEPVTESYDLKDDNFEFTLGAVEGYLSSRAEQGDAVAAGLVPMVKKLLAVRYAAMELSDNGVNFSSFASEVARTRHFATNDNAVDDHYFIDLRGDILDIGLADVGSDAQDDQ